MIFLISRRDTTAGRSATSHTSHRTFLVRETTRGISSNQTLAFVNLILSNKRKRMRSGDRPGLQNRRAASSGVAGGFDPHSLPPNLLWLRFKKHVSCELNWQLSILP